METQAEGEAGSMQGARGGTWSWDPGVMAWAEGRCSTTEPPKCPHIEVFIPSNTPHNLFSWLFYATLQKMDSEMLILVQTRPLSRLSRSRGLLHLLKIKEAIIPSPCPCPTRVAGWLQGYHVLKALSGDPWVVQRFSTCLWPRSWSWGPWIKSHLGLPAWSLLLPPPVSQPLSLSVSLMNK